MGGTRPAVERGPWTIPGVDVAPGRVRRYRPERSGRAVAWSEALAAWEHDATFRDAFIDALRTAPFEAFLWETPALSAARVDGGFEWVVIDSPQLARATAEPEPFREHVDQSEDVRAFPNLGGDARLVVPCAAAPLDRYAHLGAFVRGAPSTQVHAMWQLVAREVKARLARSAAPVWVSTSGLGVYWVHVRLDSRPKYYAHADYRRAPR